MFVSFTMVGKLCHACSCICGGFHTGAVGGKSRVHERQTCKMRAQYSLYSYHICTLSKN